MTDVAAAPGDSTRAQETLTCEVCGEIITGPAGGAGSAKFKLASHRYRIHGIRSTGKSPRAARGRESQTDEELAARPVVGIIRDARDQIPLGTGAPSSTDLTKALGRGLGLVSMAVATYAVESDEGLTDDERDDLAADLSLSERQASDVMRPIGKAFAGTNLNRKFGRQVVENVDAVSSVAELVTLGLNWRRYFRDRAARSPRATRGAVVDTRAAVIPDGSVPPPPGPGPGGRAVAAPSRPRRNAQASATPPPQQGVIITPDMIRTARNGST